MLTKLFTSNTRSKIITIFMLNPDDELYVREITKKINENINSVRRELSNLEDMGLLISRKAGNLKYFRLNKDFYLYSELYSMVMKTEGVARLLKDIEKWGPINLAFIYGSFASQKADPNSDIDLCIVGSIDEANFIRELNSLEKKLSREINYIKLSNEEFQEKIDKKDPFIMEILREPKIMIVGELDFK
nr:nucleotidyltransferase domain-containing protein [uncultured Methanobacterium sp.]